MLIMRLEKILMRITFILVLILFSFLALSQNNQIDANGLKQGKWEKRQPNGRLIYEGSFKDDKPVGEWKRYHPGGQVKAVLNYTGDTATVRFFDLWRKPVAEGTYYKQKKEGTWKTFSQNRIIAEESFKNDMKHGTSKKFYETGEVMEETDWVNDKQEGNHQVFFKNGKPYLQFKMSNNQRHGVCISYYQNGQRELEGYYTKGLRDKEWRFYDLSGNLSYTLFYDNGELLNPAVRDSISNLSLENLEKGKEGIPDPEKYLQNPSEYMDKMNINR